MTVTLLEPFEPLEWQIPVWNDISKVILLTGGAGGGKSTVAAEKMHAFCMKYPGACCLIVRKTREVLNSSVVPFMQNAVIGDDPRVKYNERKTAFFYDNGSVIYCRGMKDEKQREQIRSVGTKGGVDMIWMEEATAFHEEDFNELLPRLRGRAVDKYYAAKGNSPKQARKMGWRQIILTTNPDHPYHWIKQRLMDGGKAKVYISKAKDNFHNPDDYQDTLNDITGVRGIRLREGKWEQAQGMVYSEYVSDKDNPAANLIDPFPIPKHWKRFRTVDFGYTNPFCCLWGAVDEDGRIYIYKQIYYSKRLVATHAQNIKHHSVGEKYDNTVVDWDAEDRATLESEGLRPTVRARKDIRSGIQAVKNRLKPAGDGRPRLFIFRDCLVETDPKLAEKYKPTGIEQEFYSYVWDEERAKHGFPEEPVDRDNHALDALRYLVMHLDKLNSVDIVPLSRMYANKRRS